MGAVPAPMPSPLIMPATLAALLERPAAEARPVVIDVRRGLGPAPERIPGAVALDIDRDLASAPGPGGRHPLPAPEQLQAALRRAGVRRGSSVVVLDEADGSFAARGWWLLRWAGAAADRVAVLDGGWAAWVAAGLPAGSAAPDPEPGDVDVRPGTMPVLDADGAAGVAGSGVLMDARARVRYRGESEPLDPVAGHIPGAVNAPVAELVGPDGHWRPPAELAEDLTGLGVAPGARVGAYCGSGVTAAALVLAAEYAGVRSAAEPVPLYVGSWSEWITRPERPVATGFAP